jgi:hypothetical protein
MAIDIFGLPDTSDNFQIFNVNGLSDWQTWIKPRNCRLVSFLVIGGGGGGAGGASGSSINRLGGAGGGSSGISRGIYPANMLPDILYIEVGAGGIGGSSATNGGAGNLSYISVEPDTTPAFVLLASGAAAAGGGGGATLATAGVASTIFNQTNYNLSYLGITNLIAGGAGGAGGANTGGNGSQSNASMVTQPGSGGGGSSSLNSNGAGGGIAVQGNLIPVAIGGGAGGSSATAQSGIKVLTPSTNSLGIRLPFFNSATAGGGGNGAGTGGAGGNGAYGCGGGGGGAGTIGGRGGNGGDGIVIITSY